MKAEKNEGCAVGKSAWPLHVTTRVVQPFCICSLVCYHEAKYFPPEAELCHICQATFQCWLTKLYCNLTFFSGPGLGRNQSMLGRISIVIDKCKAANLPIVIDADGLWHLTNNPSVIKGYKKAVLTPNPMEFSRLVHSVLKRGDVPPNVHPDPEIVLEVANALGGVTIVHKGSVDVISNGKFTEHCTDDGCPRR